MGEGIVKFYQDRIDRRYKIAFWWTFAICLLVHIYKFTNTLPNHDSYFNVYSNQDMTISGRWFLSVACGVSSYFDLPWVNGLLCAVYLGITAALIAAVLDIHNPVVIALTGAIIAACPSTTETFFFEFTADGYLMGLMLSAAAACLSCKGKNWRCFVLSGVCCCLSCAVYQAYISFAVVLCIFYLINCLINEEMIIRQAWRWIGKHILIYGAALAAYYAVWKLILMVTGQEAVDYQGINTVGQVGISTILSGAIKSVTNLILLFLEWNVLEHPITLYGVLNIVFIICFAVILAVVLIKSKAYQNAGRLLMILFCLLMSIPAISVWNFLSDSVEYRPMMLYSAALFYVYGLVLCDNWVKPRQSTVFGLFMTVMVLNFSVMANISYFYLDKCYEKTYYMGSRMMERIEEMNAEHTVSGIAFLGNRVEDVAITPGFPGNRIHLLSSKIEQDFLYDHVHAHLFLHNALGLELPGVTSAQMKELEKSPAVQEMGVWPSEDSVAIIDDVLVIKLAGEPIDG